MDDVQVAVWLLPLLFPQNRSSDIRWLSVAHFKGMAISSNTNQRIPKKMSVYLPLRKICLKNSEFDAEQKQRPADFHYEEKRTVPLVKPTGGTLDIHECFIRDNSNQSAPICCTCTVPAVQ
jgi:hypothetical protein